MLSRTRRRLASARDRREGERGQIMVIFTIVIVLLMALTAIVIDVSLLRNDEGRLQNALDSGALAAAQKLPATGGPTGNVLAIQGVATAFTLKNFPGVNPPGTSFACLIGIDVNGLPRVIDMPNICKVNFAATSPVWRCTAVTCWAPCDPVAIPTDVCNTVVLADSKVRQYTFGRIVGVNSGNTGVIVSAACTGACGGSPQIPVDVALLLDRTGSMDQSASVANLRNGAGAVLKAFDPSVQRVALGFTGPTSTWRVTGGNYGSDPTSNPLANCSPTPNTVHALALDPGSYQAGPTPAFQSAGATADNGTAPATNSNLALPKPAGTASGNFLLATIAVDGGSGTTITPPTGGVNSSPNNWVLIRRTNNGTNLGIATYRKFAGSGDVPAGVTTYTFGISGTGGRRAVGGIVRYTGVDTANPVIDDGDNTGGSSTTLTAPSITANDNSALIAAYASDTSTNFPAASPTGMPSGFTERLDAANPNAAGPTVGVGTGSQGGAGGTGTKIGRTANAAVWAAQLIALQGPPGPSDVYGTNVNTDMAQWIPIGFTGTDTDAPAVTYSEGYNNGLVPPVLNNSSHIMQAIRCFDVSGTGTNLARPLIMATQYLATNGRPKVKQGIILETDGAPNNGGYGPSTDYTNSGVQAAANAAKAAGIEVFTIGYGDVDVSLLAAMSTTSMPSDTPGKNTTSCLPKENTDGDHFFCLPLDGDLSTVLRQAAIQLAGGSRLVQLYPQPIVTAISPTGGPNGGGTTVTVTGKYFTEAYSVTFGGTKGSNVQVISDTTIKVTAPAGPANAFAHVQVSTPGGSSNLTNADQYHYGP